MKRKSTTPKNRATRGAKRNHTTEAVIPVTVQNQPGRGGEIGTAEISVAVQGSSDSVPGTVIGKAEIPVTMNRSRKAGKGRVQRNRAPSVITVLPVAMNREKRYSSPKAKPAAPPVSLDERRRARAMRDPFVRTLNSAINVEQGVFEIAAQFSLAAIDAAESVVQFLLPSPAVTQKAVEMSEVLPWPLDQTLEGIAEMPGEERIA